MPNPKAAMLNKQNVMSNPQAVMLSAAKHLSRVSNPIDRISER